VNIDRYFVSFDTVAEPIETARLSGRLGVYSRNGARILDGVVLDGEPTVLIQVGDELIRLV